MLNNILIGVVGHECIISSGLVSSFLATQEDIIVQEDEVVGVTINSKNRLFYKPKQPDWNTTSAHTIRAIIIKNGGKNSIGIISSKYTSMVIVYDVNNRESFDYVKEVTQAYINSIKHSNTSLIMIAMNCDNEKRRVVSRQEAEDAFNRINVHGCYLLNHEVFDNNYMPTIRESIIYQVFKHHNNTYINQPSIELIYLNVDRIKPISSPYKITQAPPHPPPPPLQHHLFKSVFGSLTINNIIFKMVGVIHKEMGLKSCKLNSQEQMIWLSSPRLYHMIPYRQKFNYLPIKINVDSFEFGQFLRLNNDHNIFKQCRPSKSHNRTIMENACVGGNVDIVHSLLELEYDLTNKSFYLAAVFGHLQLVKFIINECGFLNQVSQSSLDLSREEMIERAIVLATTFNHQDLTQYLQGIRNLKPPDQINHPPPKIIEPPRPQPSLMDRIRDMIFHPLL